MNKITTRFMKPGIVWLEFESQYWMCSTFMRMQEFYESPLPGFRGNYFTAEKFMDAYASSKGGRFNYFSEWGGFNVPGHVVMDFISKFNDLSEKERIFIDEIHNSLPGDLGHHFYVIGTVRKPVRGSPLVDVPTEAFRHEIAHALYYLDPEYKRDIDVLLNGLSRPLVENMDTYHRECGYDEAFFQDEIQATLIEGGEGFESYFEFPPPENINEFKERFEKATTFYGIN